MLLNGVSSLISVTMKSNLFSPQAKAWHIPLAEWWYLISQGICNWRENPSCDRTELYISDRLRSGEMGTCLIINTLCFPSLLVRGPVQIRSIDCTLNCFFLTHQSLIWHPFYWHMSPLLRANHVSFRIMNVPLWHKQINMFNKLLTIMQCPSFSWLHL